MGLLGLGLNIGKAVGAEAAKRAGLRRDPLMAFNFLVEVDGIISGGFSQVEGLGGEVESASYIEGGDHAAPYAVLNDTRWTNLVLSNGIAGTTALWDWFQATARGAYRPKDGMIVMLGRDRIPAAIWEFREALPVKWIGPTLDATASDSVAVERLELAHRGLRTPAGLALRSLGLARG